MPPALRGPASSQSPPSHLPASAARPGFSRPAVRFGPPEPEPRQSAGPGAGAASRPEPGGRRRTPRASERAGGRQEPRCCCRASPHPLRPSVPPSLLPSQPPSSQLTAPSLRFPPSFFFFLFLPLRSFQTQLARSFARSFSYLQSLSFPLGFFFSDSTFSSISSHFPPPFVLLLVSLRSLFSPYLFLLVFFSF